MLGLWILILLCVAILLFITIPRKKQIKKFVPKISTSTSQKVIHKNQTKIQLCTRYKLQADIELHSGNIERAIELYILSAQHGNIEALFNVVNIYRFGIGDTELYRNLNNAQRTCRVISQLGNAHQSLTARQLDTELQTELNYISQKSRANTPQKSSTYDDFLPPAEIANPRLIAQIMKIRDPSINIIVDRDVQTQNNQPRVQPRLNLHDQRDIDNPNNWQDMNWWRHDVVTPRVEVVVQPTNQNMIRNDTQNVHDSMVVRSIKKGITDLERQHPVDNYDFQAQQTMNQVREEILNRNNQKALQALDAIERNTIPISSLEKREIDVLTLVWNRINDPVNQERKTNLIDILSNQLNDCVDTSTGGVHCASGRVSRVMQTLEGTDAEPIVSIKPEWVITREIVDSAANIYKNLIDSADQPTKQACEIDQDDATHQQKELFAAFKNQYNTLLREKFTTDYVEHKLLSPELVDVKIAEIVNAI